MKDILIVIKSKPFLDKVMETVTLKLGTKSLLVSDTLVEYIISISIADHYGKFVKCRYTPKYSWYCKLNIISYIDHIWEELLMGVDVMCDYSYYVSVITVDDVIYISLKKD